MDVFADFAARILSVLKELYPDHNDLNELAKKATAEPPRDPSHGAISSNIAMVCAKALKTNPRH